MCIATIYEHQELSITEADIESTHQIGKSRDASKNSKLIIVNSKKTKRNKYCNYREFKSHSNEKILLNVEKTIVTSTNLN